MDLEKAKKILLPAARQHQHNDCSGLIPAYDYEETNKIVSNLLEPLVMLRSLAKQLNKWADESRTGGWSTHQVKPIQEKAAEIYQLLDKVERIEASA